MCRFTNLCKHFFPVQIDIFSVFFSGGVKEIAIFHILLIVTGKMHGNGLSGMYLGFEACWIQCCRFWVSAISSPERSQFQAKISHFVDFDWENALKLLEWHVFKVRGMLNPMALVGSLYNKWFMKNQNCRRHIAENGIQNHENGLGHMQQSSLGPILPLHHVSEPYILTFP